MIKQLVENGEIERESRQQGCDLSVNNPKITDKSHCIPARYDNGITTRKSDCTGVLLSNKGNKFEKSVDIASTLLARDYKGFGNQNMTGVIENRKDSK